MNGELSMQARKAYVSSNLLRVIYFEFRSVGILKMFSICYRTPINNSKILYVIHFS